MPLYETLVLSFQPLCFSLVRLDGRVILFTCTIATASDLSCNESVFLPSSLIN